MSNDQKVALAALAVGTIAAVAGVVAAVYAIRADRATRKGALAADDRYQVNIQPRLQIVLRFLTAGGWYKVSLTNAGGPVVGCLLLVQNADVLFRFAGRIAQHSGPADLNLSPVGTTSAPPLEPAQLLIALSQDVSGNWWDASTDELIGSEVEGWLDIRLGRAGIRGDVGTIEDLLKPTSSPGEKPPGLLGIARKRGW